MPQPRKVFHSFREAVGAAGDGVGALRERPGAAGARNRARPRIGPIEGDDDEDDSLGRNEADLRLLRPGPPGCAEVTT